MTARSAIVVNQLGMHARAAAKFVHLATRFRSQVRVAREGREMDGKSIMGILLLAAACGSTITVTADGADEHAAVEALIASRADVNVPTPEGVSPLMVALDNDHNDVATLLLDRGANPHLSDWWGRTALYIAIDRKESAGGGRGGAGGRGGVGRGGGAAAVSRGSSPAVSSREAQARQREASSMDIVNRLLAADVDPSPELNMHRPSRGGNSGRFSDRQLSTGCTALYRATEAGDMEVIRSLLAKGANPNINDMGFHAIPGGGRR